MNLGAAEATESAAEAAEAESAVHVHSRTRQAGYMNALSPLFICEKADRHQHEQKGSQTLCCVAEHECVVSDAAFCVHVIECNTSLFQDFAEDVGSCTRADNAYDQMMHTLL